MKLRKVSLVVGLLSLALSQVPLTVAQTTTETASALPRLVRFSGTVKDLNGNPLTGVVGITFAFYSEEIGGAALWLETQNVTADRNGHYVALLGSTKPDGLPTELFTSGQARWVGVQVSGQPEQPRVLLVSAPYALKAGDAETIGGLPPSAFVLANGSQGSGAKGVSAPASASSQKNTAPPANPNVTGKGVVNYIPMWNTTSDIVDSLIFQKTAKIGINTAAPAAILDVNGKSDIRDTLTLFPKGTDPTLAISGTAFKIDHTGAVTTPVLNATDALVSDGLSIVNSGANNPLYVVTSSSTNATAIYGAASSTTGTAFGVEGVTASSGTSYGVVGDAVASTGTPYGVYGVTPNSYNGVGVFGQNGTLSDVGTMYAGTGAGIWGDGGASAVAVVGTVDNGAAGLFLNNSDSYSLQVGNAYTGGSPFIAFAANGASCNVDNNGNLNCTGSKNAIVPIDGGRRTVALSAIESPQNWFEDAGSTQLVNGAAVVAIDPEFLQTVATQLEYQVFLTPYGDCKGLYVTNRASTSFEVHELSGGTASLRFGFRIMALRKNYENVRFADHTHDLDGHKRMLARAHAATETHSQSPTPTKMVSPARPLVRTRALE